MAQCAQSFSPVTVADGDVAVSLVWDWVTHHLKCNKELWVHPKTMKRTADNVFIEKL